MKECDLILKGGVTSGVVYPKAIRKIGEHYRLRSIGGTSAGAMAAALAAAAEYRRQQGGGGKGYQALDAVDTHLATNMRAMLQPSPALAPVFHIGIRYLEQGGLGRGVRARFRTLRDCHRLLKPYRRQAEPAAMRNGGLVFGGGVLGALALGSGALAGAAAVAGAGVFAVQTALNVLRSIEAAFKAHDYGVLPGTTQGQNKEQAVIDWLADEIDRIAGNWPGGTAPETPLTAGDLHGKGIVLSSVTTDLTSQRPFQMPLKVPEHYYFREEDLKRVIPPRVVRWMVEKSAGTPKRISIGGRMETFLPLPDWKDIPVILVTRMSMSFPGLIQAVPLWRYDSEVQEWVRCLFSDGGISSNLPVHMFDAWLPRRPTFAISLGTYDKHRHGADPEDPADVSNRVRFTDAKRNVLEYPSVRIDGVFSFLLYMFYSAKDWQDRLQSDLTGFAERVATIYLDQRQGGLNLDMPAAEIERLQRYGERAGDLIATTFNFDENRFRRALSILPILGENLEQVSKYLNWQPPGGGGTTLKPYSEVLEKHQSEAFPQSADWQAGVLLEFAKELAKLGSTPVTAELKNGNLPHTDAKLSLTATPDLTKPKDAAV
ncbi:patatin-like phospholipase family protein [Leisingera thetidis]|uniref:patatin-like phospholipase family protein n=1 Tax=Leisingera thetidis TaxID=2930199 RepID=UPI0021F7B8FA|nr:patatin-like phospholipase family protein [Leisingera thetidis]